MKRIRLGGAEETKEDLTTTTLTSSQRVQNTRELLEVSKDEIYSLFVCSGTSLNISERTSKSQKVKCVYCSWEVVYTSDVKLRSHLAKQEIKGTRSKPCDKIKIKNEQLF